MSLKKCLSVSFFFTGFIAELISKSSFAITVAGCDNAGSYCDITAKYRSKVDVYAPRAEVWSAQDSQNAINSLNARIDQRATEQTNARNDAVTALNGTIQTTNTQLSERINEERRHTDAVKREIRDSLKEELQKLLRAQTCEDRIIPSVGTAGRSIQVTAKIECIKTALNNWRGVNAQGQPIVVADGNALSREQVAQMLRMLEVLIVDTDTTPAQRQYISDTISQFAYFNILNTN